jgi:hypothetical protein
LDHVHDIAVSDDVYPFHHGVFFLLVDESLTRCPALKDGGDGFQHIASRVLQPRAAISSRLRAEFVCPTGQPPQDKASIILAINTWIRVLRRDICKYRAPLAGIQN